MLEAIIIAIWGFFILRLFIQWAVFHMGGGLYLGGDKISEYARDTNEEGFYRDLDESVAKDVLRIIFRPFKSANESRLEFRRAELRHAYRLGRIDEMQRRIDIKIKEWN